MEPQILSLPSGPPSTAHFLAPRTALGSLGTAIMPSLNLLISRPSPPVAKNGLHACPFAMALPSRDGVISLTLERKLVLPLLWSIQRAEVMSYEIQAQACNPWISLLSQISVQLPRVQARASMLEDKSDKWPSSPSAPSTGQRSPRSRAAWRTGCRHTREPGREQKPRQVHPPTLSNHRSISQMDGCYFKPLMWGAGCYAAKANPYTSPALLRQWFVLQRARLPAPSGSELDIFET